MSLMRRILLVLFCLHWNTAILAQNVLTNGSQNQNSAQPSSTTNTDNSQPINGGGAQNAPSQTVAPGASQVIKQPDGTQVMISTVYCPAPSQLIKNGLFWGTAQGGWKGYSESFDSSIASFIGAQWAGINVGRMVCIYKGNLSMSFPVMLQNDTLSQAPSGALWGNDLGGYRNCHSTNPVDCPFIVKSESVNIQQIYKSLDFFKGKPNPLQNNN